MGIGTLSLDYLEYGQSHLSDGARRSLRRPRWGTMITANGAQTKAEFKRLITRRDRHESTVELAQIEHTTAELVEAVVTEPQFASFAEWLEAMNDEHPLVDPDGEWTHADYAQMLQAYEDDSTAWDVPTSRIYGDTVELWDADEWTQLGFTITTPR